MSGVSVTQPVEGITRGRAPEGMRCEPMSSPGGTCGVTAGDRMVPASAARPEGFREKLELTQATNMAKFSTSEDGM